MIVHLILQLVVFLGVLNLLRISFYFFGSDLYNLRNHVRNKASTTDTKPHPLFSVIVPAYNEEKTISACVKSIIANNYPKQLMQIIVVDDGSDDQTSQLVENIKKTNPSINIISIKRNRGGKANALNFALQNIAQGELVMCLDADSSLAPNAIINSVKYFQRDPRLTALAANVKIRNNGTLLSLIQKFEYIVSYQMKRAQTAYNIEYIIGGIGSTFRLSALGKIKYYDTNTITEDIDLTMKIIRNGNKNVRVAYAADVVAYTEPVESISSLIRQRFRWKYGRYQTFFKNKIMFFNRKKEFGKLLTFFQLPYALISDMIFLFEPLVIFVVLMVIFYLGDFWTFLITLSVMIFYLSLNIAKEDTVGLKNKIQLILLTPFIFFLFYILSFVEYVALIKALIRVRNLPASIKKNDQSWTPVERVIIKQK